MKRIITITATLFFAVLAGLSQGIESDALYGVNFSTIYSGSGHGSGYVINGNILKGRKSLEVGLIYKENEQKILGGDFKYKVFLGELGRLNSENTIIKPYLQYNLIYQKATSTEPTVIELGKSTVEIENEDPGLVATMEHYAGMGLQVKIFNNAYLDTSCGLGTYFGSIGKTKTDNTIGIHKDNHGYTVAFKVGLGYRFN
jgi:hypothetical protein